MGLLDDILGQAGGQGGDLGSMVNLVAKNPQVISAVVAMLNPRDASVGGNTGLGDVIGTLTRGGLGEIASSWVGSGSNKAVDPGQLAGALGPDLLRQFAQKAGVAQGDAGSVLASVLPQVVNHVTPKGQLPDAGGLDDLLGSLLGGLGGR